MDTFLTLVIALGGIATGIGAIWTAMLTRSHLGEQNQRARLNLEVDLLFRYADRFENELFLRRRRAAAKYLLDNAFVGDEMVGVERLNRAALSVCGYFEDLAYLQRVGALEAETVRNSLGWAIRTYWPLCKPAIERERVEWKVPTMYEEFEHLSRVVADLERELGIEPPTDKLLRQAMEEETIAGEDEAVIDEERPKPE